MAHHGAAGRASDTEDRDVLELWKEFGQLLKHQGGAEEECFGGGLAAGKPKQTLKTYCHNVNGIKDQKKRKQFRKALFESQEDYDVIMLLETNLDETLADLVVFDSDKYLLFRTDRSLKNAEKRRGFGVLIGVKKSICRENETKNICEPYSSTFEEVWVKLSADKRKKLKTDVILGAAYFPPRTFSKESDKLCASIEEIVQRHPNTPVIFFGDFNLPAITWKKSEDKDILAPIKASYGKILLHFYHMAMLGFSQHNHVEYKQDTMLDLVFSNVKQVNVQRTAGLVKLEECHPPLQVTLELEADGTMEVYENRLQL